MILVDTTVWVDYFTMTAISTPFEQHYFFEVAISTGIFGALCAWVVPKAVQTIPKPE
jgi:hypothetical protein